MNKLYYGDCLTIMQDKLLLNSVDLIYLDPPFKSDRNYNAIYQDETGRPLPDQVEAFCDTWTLDEATERSIRQMPVLMREAGIEDTVAEFWKLWMNALRGTNPSLLAYLAYMAERLLAMRPLLRPTGSIYLHCDSTASHYIKVLMDSVFGHLNFRREIIWNNKDSSGFKSQAKNWIRGHDIILYYVKSENATFNKEYLPLDERTVKRYDKIDSEGKRYKIYRTKGKPDRRSYLKEERGVAVSSVWADIPSFQTVNNTGEYLGYQTQKPLALLERIINASTNVGDVVLDPFAGCATTVEAAHKLQRQWIGIDVAIHAIKRVATKRLHERLRLVEGVDFEIEGVPRTLEGAQDLWERDKYHFQKWAVESVDGFVTTRRSGDGGVDGRIYFAMPDKKDLQSMAVEVKGGKNVGIGVMRELRGVLDNDAAQLAGLIVMEPLGATKERNFKSFMASAGHLEVNGTLYPRLQMLTVDEMLDGRRFQTPGVAARGIGQQTLEVSS